jgi:hypothetical protein
LVAPRLIDENVDEALLLLVLLGLPKRPSLFRGLRELNDFVIAAIATVAYRGSHHTHTLSWPGTACDGDRAVFHAACAIGFRTWSRLESLAGR